MYRNVELRYIEYQTPFSFATHHQIQCYIRIMQGTWRNTHRIVFRGETTKNRAECTALHCRAHIYYRLQTGLDVLFNTKKTNIQHSTLKTDVDYYPSPRKFPEMLTVSLPRFFPEMLTVSLPRIFPEISGATAVNPVGGSVRLRASPRAGAFISPARAVYNKTRSRSKTSINRPINGNIIIADLTVTIRLACWALGTHRVVNCHAPNCHAGHRPRCLICHTLTTGKKAIPH